MNQLSREFEQALLSIDRGHAQRILQSNHGEIPFQVPEAVLHAIVETAEAWAP